MHGVLSASTDTESSESSPSVVADAEDRVEIDGHRPKRCSPSGRNDSLPCWVRCMEGAGMGHC